MTILFFLSFPEKDAKLGRDLPPIEWAHFYSVKSETMKKKNSKYMCM